jgi:hypothetical protein
MTPMTLIVPKRVKSVRRRERIKTMATMIGIENTVESHAPREKLMSSPMTSGSAEAAAIKAYLGRPRNITQTTLTIAGANAAL